MFLRERPNILLNFGLGEMGWCFGGLATFEKSLLSDLLVSYVSYYFHGSLLLEV